LINYILTDYEIEHQRTYVREKLETCTHILNRIKYILINDQLTYIKQVPSYPSYTNSMP
jgi:hypothetical protein